MKQMRLISPVVSSRNVVSLIDLVNGAKANEQEAEEECRSANASCRYPFQSTRSEPHIVLMPPAGQAPRAALRTIASAWPHDPFHPNLQMSVFLKSLATHPNLKQEQVDIVKALHSGVIARRVSACRFVDILACVKADLLVFVAVSAKRENAKAGVVPEDVREAAVGNRDVSAGHRATVVEALLWGLVNAIRVESSARICWSCRTCTINDDNCSASLRLTRTDIATPLTYRTCHITFGKSRGDLSCNRA